MKFVTILQALLLFAVLWSVAAWLGGLPSLFEILGATGQMIQRGTYFHDVAISLTRFGIGWLIGASLALPLGLFTGRLAKLAAPLEVNLHVLRAIPVIALVPLAVYWWGIGEAPKYFLVAWGVFFPVWLNVHNGARQVNQRYLHAAQSLGATRWELSWRVVLPSVSYATLTGFRVAIGVGLICVVAGELTGAYEQGFFSQGLGYRIQRAADLNHLAEMLSCIFTFGAIGFVADRLFTQVARPAVLKALHFDPYRSHSRDGTHS